MSGVVPEGDLVGGERPFRLAQVVSHPIQYFAPLYRAVSERPEIELTVHYCSDATLREYHDPGFDRAIAWDVDLDSGYDYRIAPSAEGRALERVRTRPQFDLFRALVKGRYDGIWVHGYAYPNAWLAASAAWITGAKLLIREEQTLIPKRSRPKRAAKRVLLGALFRRATGLYIGIQNRRYFEHYGVRPDRLYRVPYCVNNGALQSEAAVLAPLRAALRADLGINDDAPVILYSGKLMQYKQPLDALDAFALVRAETPCWLLVVGDGPLVDAFDRRVAEHGIPNVLRPGFLNQSELPRAYAAADLLVLSSYEPWGLVVNEALNFSLPVVAADTVGCAEDLVQDGVNGFRFPGRDVIGLAERLKRLVVDPDLRLRMGAEGRKLIEFYTIEDAADGIVRACLEERLGA